MEEKSACKGEKSNSKTGKSKRHKKETPHLKINGKGSEKAPQKRKYNVAKNHFLFNTLNRKKA